MSFPRYPKYKDSGVEWLGQVPEHWEVKKFRHLFRESPEKIESEVVGTMLSVSGYRGIEVKDYDDENRRRLDDELIGYRIVRVGQLVVNTMWLNYAGLGVSAHEGHVSPAYRCYWIGKGLNGRFCHHLLRSGLYVQGYTRLLTGIRPNSLQMSRDDLMEFPVLVPSPSDQTNIAEFLDQETAKIDELVAEQHRLMELLKEKRQAVISHAVTKGLNPNAALKPSGIEWLGDVPAHWDVSLLKRAFRSVDYGISDSLDSEGAVAILRMGNIENGKVVMDDLKYTGAVDSSLILVPGDLLYNRTNSLDLIGKVGMFIGSKDATVSFASYLVRLRTVEESIPEYFAYLLNTDGILGVARANAFVAIGQCNLNPTRYGQIGVAIPPKSEQRAIVEHLSTQTAKFNALTAEAQRAIDLLQERRTALISAAVTGRIDVRNT
jgi:type I restriction enzyme S subunit